ncbi:MAG TPA: hypothetical protein VNL71_13590 [Chloroflexota bacterium]|nr:hypothetical protein [Chloroflexota bacterium]
METGDDSGPRQHRTARHLDDPTAILGGLSFPQLFGVMLGLGISYFLWGLTKGMGYSGLLGDLHLFLVGGVGMVIGMGFILQFRGKTEPFVPQLAAFVLRPKRFRPEWTDRHYYD